VLDSIFLGFWKEEFFLHNLTYFFPKIFIRGWAVKNSLTISAIEHILLSFWKENLIVNIICFVSLLILCLEFGVIKRLLWPLNGLEAPF